MAVPDASNPRGCRLPSQVVCLQRIFDGPSACHAVSRHGSPAAPGGGDVADGAAGQVAGPRRRRGVRHPIVSVVLIAASAVVAGARSYTVIGQEGRSGSADHPGPANTQVVGASRCASRPVPRPSVGCWSGSAQVGRSIWPVAIQRGPRQGQWTATAPAAPATATSRPHISRPLPPWSALSRMLPLHDDTRPPVVAGPGGYPVAEERGGRPVMASVRSPLQSRRDWQVVAVGGGQCP